MMKKTTLSLALCLVAFCAHAQVAPQVPSSGQITGVSGNGHTLVTVHGSPTGGHCPEWDPANSGDLIDSGAACGSGAGGSISGGALGSAPYQSAANTTALLASPTTAGHTFVYSWQPTGSAVAPSVLDVASYLAAPPCIGCTTPAAGTFTTLSFTTLQAPTTSAQFATYQQGSTSAGQSPCNAGNTICEQAPTGVTSYVLTKPSAAPSNNFSAKTTTTAGVESYSKMAQAVVLTGTAYTNATTTFSNVSSTTNLSFSLDSATSYAGDCYLVYSASAATAGPKIEFTGPSGSGTALVYSSRFQLTATPTYAESAAATAYSTSLTAGTSVTTSTNLAVRIEFGIQNGGSAGTLQLLAAANGTGTLTIQPGSYCRLQ